MKSYRHSSAQGEREYLLFVPKGCDSTPLPLIIMLHGCKQDAADFSLGTGMNVLAEEEGCLVAYPIQPGTANHEKCWNWYQPQHQHRDFGEPSIIAGITREIMANFKVDAARVYVAGMSAGGAMAAVMIHTHPDLYAAAGIHSGLPYGSATGLFSALGAMKMGISAPFGLAAVATDRAQQRPLIVFHGDLDGTIVPSNSWELLKGFGRDDATVSEKIADSDEGGRSTLSTMESSEGIDAEHWSVHGASHAWSGGNELGSYTASSGPDASAEMMRFFLAHAQEPTIA